MIISSLLAALGGMGPGPLGPILGVVFIAAGLGAFACGLVSILRNKEQSVLVYLAVAIGTFAMIFLLGELLVPH